MTGTSEDCPILRLVTFNICHGATPEGRVDIGLLADICAAFGADVLALQEVDVLARRSGRVDTVDAVAAATGMASVFGPARRLGRRGRMGNALLVRGALEDVEVVGVPRLGREAPRSAIFGTALVDGRRLSVAVTHLSRARVSSEAQLTAVARELVGRPAPAALLGDLNRRPDEVSPLLEPMGLSVAPTDLPTYPAVDPTLRIDHIATSGLRLEAVSAPAVAISDHRPLIVDVH